MVQETAESFTPHERTATAGPGGRSDQPTAQSLVRTFFVVVRHVLAHELPQMRFAQWNHAFKTFFLNRTIEAFHERIQVRTASRQANRLDSGARETVTEFLSEDRI